MKDIRLENLGIQIEFDVICSVDQNILNFQPDQKHHRVAAHSSSNWIQFLD